MGLLMLFKMNVRAQLKILMGETHNDPQETSYKLKENIINISLPACNVFRMRNNKLVKSICIYLHHVRKIKRKTNKVMRLNCQVTCLLIIYLYIYIYIYMQKHYFKHFKLNRLFFTAAVQSFDHFSCYWNIKLWFTCNSLTPGHLQYLTV